jgi:hypothetical protein
MRMNRFRTQDCIDFVNLVAPQKQNETMREHLSASCKRCLETVALWQKVHTLAAVKVSYKLLEANVRIARKAFAPVGRAAPLSKTSSSLEVLFDSCLHPTRGGARSSGPGTRQVLYRAEPYQIDIQIEAKPEGNRLIVTGQLLDVSLPGIVGRDVKITLSNYRGNVIHTITNQLGEFRAEIENSGDLELSFPGQGDKAIVISLRNALGKSPGGKE